MKIPRKRELQQIVLEFVKIFSKYTAEPYCFLVNDTTLPSDNLLRFRGNLLKINHDY